jgi:poly(3-hydroxybutyrate) depolymerase
MKILLPFVLILSANALASEAPALNIDETRITASGISAGSHMAHQMHIAYSDVFSGVAIISAGNCSRR